MLGAIFRSPSEELVLEIGRLLNHELSHASDFCPPTERALSGALSIYANVVGRISAQTLAIMMTAAPGCASAVGATRVEQVEQARHRRDQQRGADQHGGDQQQRQWPLRVGLAA